jgi:hypothetical protein
LDLRERYEAQKVARAARSRESASRRWWSLGQHDPIARYTAWLVLFTSLLAIATAGSMLVLWKTDNTLNGTLAETEKSVKLAASTATRRLRAYIGFTDKPPSLKCKDCKDSGHDEDDDSITIEMKNFGLTPAYRVHGWFAAKETPLGEQLAEGFDYPAPQNLGTRFHYSTLNPGQVAPVQYNFNSNQVELVGRARKHEISLYFYGEAIFRDAFGSTRSAPFCYRYIPESPDKAWPLCPEHNSPTEDESAPAMIE